MQRTFWYVSVKVSSSQAMGKWQIMWMKWGKMEKIIFNYNLPIYWCPDESWRSEMKRWDEDTLGDSASAAGWPHPQVEGDAMMMWGSDEEFWWMAAAGIYQYSQMLGERNRWGSNWAPCVMSSHSAYHNAHWASILSKHSEQVLLSKHTMWCIAPMLPEQFCRKYHQLQGKVLQDTPAAVTSTSLDAPSWCQGGSSALHKLLPW